MIEYQTVQLKYKPSETEQDFTQELLTHTRVGWRVVGSAIYSRETGGGLEPFRTKYYIVFTLERYREV